MDPKQGLERMRWVFTKRVRFGHSDPAGIAYYPRFFEWFHDAMEDVFEAATGDSYAHVLATRAVGFPAVSTATEFKRPAVFGQLFDLEVFLSRLGRRSLTFEYRVRQAGHLLATASVKVAVMDLKTRSSRDLPEDLRALFEPYVEPDEEGPDMGRLL